jgi:AcrR family transcriptional regulator
MMSPLSEEPGRLAERQRPLEPLRADAQRNRERIVEAARHALHTSGDASMNSIAKAAGVGPGTLYRNFPDRDALIMEVYRHEITDLVNQVEPLSAEHPPLGALRLWFVALAVSLKAKRGLGDAITGSAKAKMTADSYGPVTAAMTTLLAAAQASGDVRSDLEVDDVLLLLGCLWRVPEGPAGEAQGERLLDLILDALRR